jgi:hypothetical protein
VGLEQHLWLETAGQLSLARFDDRQISTERLSAVQYVKFQLSRRQMATLSCEARIVIDHPKCQAEQPLEPVRLKELAADLE